MVLPGNAPSLRLLGWLGFRNERNVRLAADDDELELHAAAVAGPATTTPGG
jgi:hypothetical protein